MSLALTMSTCNISKSLRHYKDSGRMGPDSSKTVADDLDSPFLWLIFTANLAYILFATCQKLYAKTYPAARHHSDTFSLSIIVVHILCGATVVFGGCACWLATHWNRDCNPWSPIPTWAAHTLVVAALGHSVTNVFLLRKIPGVRVINVPLYIFITVYNAHRALKLLMSMSMSMSTSNSGMLLERELLLLWCAVSTYVWVRYFIFLFGVMMESKFAETGGSVRVFRLVYTLALPCAAVVGLGAPAAVLGGVEVQWTVGFVASVAVLGPAMVAVHWGCVRVRVRVGWGWTGSVVQFLLDTTNPRGYHGEGKGNSPSFLGGQQKNKYKCGEVEKTTLICPIIVKGDISITLPLRDHYSLRRQDRFQGGSYDLNLSIFEALDQ